MKGNIQPELQEKVLWRPRDLIQLVGEEVINDTIPRITQSLPCAPFRKFGLYVNIKSTSTPDNVHIEPEFLDRWTNQWFSYKQWPFAALFWEDTDTAAGINECFYGEVVGRFIRVKITGVNVAASGNVLGAAKFFTVKVALDFWD